MKLSLKEFFVHEAKSSGSGRKSSINIDVKSSAQVNIKEGPTGAAKSSYSDLASSEKGTPDKTVSEKALSSYKHPRTHLHSKFVKDPDIKEPWALAQHIASKNEALGDQWSGPDFGANASSEKDRKANEGVFSDYEPGGVSGRPEFDDPTKGQTGWAVVRDSGEVVGVFQDHDEADRMCGSDCEIVPAEDLEIPSGAMADYGFTGGEEDYDPEFGDLFPDVEPTKSHRDPHTPGYKSLSSWNDDEPIRPYNEHQDPTCTDPDAGSTIWSDPTQPARVKKFKNVKGNLNIDLQEMFGGTPGIDEGGPGSGRKKGSKNKPKSTAGSNITPGVPADPAELPDEWEDIDVSDFDEPASEPRTGATAPIGQPEDEPFARTADDLGDEDDLSWLDDPALGQGVDVPKREPTATEPPPPPPEEPYMSYNLDPTPPRDRGQFWRDVEAEEGETMDWDELKAAEPDIAGDIEAEYPDIADPGTFMDEPGGSKRSGALFTIDHAGDVIMRVHGARFKWDAENAEWISMDDGETPSGEF